MFYSTSIFRQSMDNLCRKARHGYHLCRADICKEFGGLSFDDIWSKHFLLKELGDIRILKIRLQNGFLNLSSSDGFRIIVCCDRKRKTIAFLNIYPKRGKLGQLDQPKEAYKHQLKVYASELKESLLIRHDIKKGFVVFVEE